MGLGFEPRLPALGYSLPAFESLLCCPCWGETPLFYAQAPAATVAVVQDRWIRIDTKTSVLRCLTLTYSFQAQEGRLVWNNEYRHLPSAAGLLGIDCRSAYLAS
jgi:hypothetical protein